MHKLFALFFYTQPDYGTLVGLKTYLQPMTTELYNENIYNACHRLTQVRRRPFLTLACTREKLDTYPMVGEAGIPENTTCTR